MTTAEHAAKVAVTEETIAQSQRLREQLARTMTELDMCIGVLRAEVEYHRQMGQSRQEATT